MQRKLALLVASALILSATGVNIPAHAQEARNVAEFCGVWRGVCQRTCPTTVTNCRDECAARTTECRTSGCFRFTRGATRCFANAADRALTDASRAPNPEAERARRAREK